MNLPEIHKITAQLRKIFGKYICSLVEHVVNAYGNLQLFHRYICYRKWLMVTNLFFPLLLWDLDLGKVLLLPRFGELPQWAVVGDTYPVGCAFHESIVHHKVILFSWTLLSKHGYKQIWATKMFETYLLNCCPSISWKIQTITILHTTLNMEFTQKDVDWTMSWCHGDMMTTCIWYQSKAYAKLLS